MPTSRTYDTTVATLQQQLPAALPSQIASLSLALVGVIHSQAGQLGAIARAMPLDTSQVCKEQRLRRFLDNTRITLGTHYQPLVARSLHGLQGQRVQVLIDRVLLRDQHNVLVVSLAFRRRSIPLAWTILPHRGSSSLAERQALVVQALALLPPGVRVSVHGDSEFRSPDFFAWLRAQGCSVLLGVSGQLYVYAAAQPGSPGQPLAQRVARGGPSYLTGVYLTQEQRYGPVQVIAWWERDDDGKLVLRGVVTDQPATARTKALGQRRMWIETVFRDWQSGGFRLHRTGITSPARFQRLLLILALAYLWLVSLGRWVVKRGYRRLIDDGTRRCWHYSLFQLGVGWVQRLHTFGQTVPVHWFLYT